jgi:adenine-specific DNA-methyltransferase
MNKLKLHTPDLTAANVERIGALFPNCLTETLDEKGNPKRAIDFDLLRQELSGDLIEGPQERYRLDWPGKREALALANTPVALTLRPCREESVDFENTKNLYIEGDNLDALKLLQETYLGKVKMIYIDPPYNTGNDFLYQDNFTATRDDYEFDSGKRDEEGRILVNEERWKQNSTNNGRFHSDWLSTMYPRIKLARNLLSDQGLILTSIDHGEIGNLRKIFDELFGESNFRNCIAVRRGIKSVQSQFEDVASLSYGHEYILVYSKSTEARLPKLMLNGEDSLPGKWDTFWRGTDRPTMRYPLFGKTPERGQWRWEKSRAERAHNNYQLYLEKISPEGISMDEWYMDTLTSTNQKLDFLRQNEEGAIQYYVPPRGGKLLSDNWMDILLSGSETLFDTEKNSLIIERAIRWLTQSNDLILDFFSGSATTAQAVMQINAEDGESRRHIMVQVPAACDEKSDAFKAGQKTIAEIGKDRIRRSGQKIFEEWQANRFEDESAQAKRPDPSLTGLSPASPPDIGFRVLKIDSSNFKEVHHAPDEVKQGQLGLHTDNIREDRTPEDLLFQVLVDWGVDLALPIATEEVAGKKVFFVDGNALAACFDPLITEGLVRELAKRKPLRAVFRDKGFGDDSMKINLEQIFKLLSPGTELKTL